MLMRYYSTHHKAQPVSFREAVINGLALDGGLYIPGSIPSFTSKFIKHLHRRTLQDIGFIVAKQYIEDEIPARKLKALVKDTLNFEIPLVEIENNIHCLELFHGPTLAFKDVGARFMARVLGYFAQDFKKEIIVLVATSGDTGSAVANGFLGVDGVKVVILYPSGKVSEIQEKQLTTLGQNITALEVDGNFDDCQRLVKTAFGDEQLKQNLTLTAANSINIARLIPQSFYYFYAWTQLKDRKKPVVFSVPSGNFGNLTGGLLAKEMGLPVQRLIAATNINDIVPHYLETGQYQPKPSQKTISNAMDVGDPSNFARMYVFYGNSRKRMTEAIQGLSFDDEETLATIRHVHQRTGYLLDPHGAVGYLGLKKYLEQHATTGIFLETAHPAKFADIIEKAIDAKAPIPDRLTLCMDKEKHAIQIGNKYDDLHQFLNDTF